MTRVLPAAVLGLIGGLTGQAAADPATIEAANAQKRDDQWHFEVTLSHGDTGWDDYADGWRVIRDDGSILGIRDLLHPHVDEQPFTRSLGGIAIPDDVETVFIKARTNVGGWSEVRFRVDLERP
jgi:hypothetical protein